MATKKKPSKSSGKANVSRIVAKSRPSAKKKTSISKGTTKAKTAQSKKATSQKKPVAKSMKSSSSAKKVQSAPSSKKKKVAPASQSTKKNATATKQKTTQKVAPSRTSTAKNTVKSKGAQPVKTNMSLKGLSQLSPSECYNVGGLCACVIETFTKGGQGRLKRVLTYLGLSKLEQANLFRVSQGLRIPKLFADGLASEKTRRSVLKGLSQFSKADDPSGKRWKTDLEDFARLLGA